MLIQIPLQTKLRHKSKHQQYGAQALKPNGQPYHDL